MWRTLFLSLSLFDMCARSLSDTGVSTDTALPCLWASPDWAAATQWDESGAAKYWFEISQITVRKPNKGTSLLERAQIDLVGAGKVCIEYVMQVSTCKSGDARTCQIRRTLEDFVKLHDTVSRPHCLARCVRFFQCLCEAMH